jgi:N-hydroxyarylamine O-acetyltransferase
MGRMTSSLVDLDSYFARIGYAGPRTPTLETLRALQALHPAAIPFENIDVVLGRGINLAPAAVDAKLIHGRRGGYCFEQNSLFKRVLRALGFQVDSLIARPRWGRPLEDVWPGTHMSLRVRIDGADWLADVGFGGCMLTAPLRLDLQDPQPTAFEPFRLRTVGEELRVEVEIAKAWRPVCDLVLSPQADADFIAPNWFTSTHPDSVFRQRLIASRTMPEVRYGLADDRLVIRSPGVETEHRTLDADGIEAALRDIFGLAVEPAWRRAMERAAG